MKRIHMFAFSAVAALLLASCTQQLAGNSSEITNGYCMAAAAPADSAMVVAYPADYIPVTRSEVPETTFTDKNGRFSLQLGHSGWNLLIYDKLQARAAFVPLPNGDSAIDTIVLADVGAIHGIVNDTLGGPGYVGVVGSPFYARIAGRSDTFSLKKMPPFDYNLGIWLLMVETTVDSNYLNGISNLKNIGSASVRVQPDSMAAVILNL